MHILALAIPVPLVIYGGFKVFQFYQRVEAERARNVAMGICGVCGVDEVMPGDDTCYTCYLIERTSP